MKTSKGLKEDDVISNCMYLMRGNAGEGEESTNLQVAFDWPEMICN